MVSFNNLNLGKEGTLSKPVSVMTLNWWEQSLHWGVRLPPQGTLTAWREWPDRSAMKFDKGKAKSLTWDGVTHPMYKLYITQTKSVFAEKGQGGLEDKLV